MNKMNDLQKVACFISGFEPNEFFSSAKNDFYYDKCHLEIEKIAQIITTSNFIEGMFPLSIMEALKVMEWLDTKFEDQMQCLTAFKEL